MLTNYYTKSFQSFQSSIIIKLPAVKVSIIISKKFPHFLIENHWFNPYAFSSLVRLPRQNSSGMKKYLYMILCNQKDLFLVNDLCQWTSWQAHWKIFHNCGTNIITWRRIDVAAVITVTWRKFKNVVLRKSIFVTMEE